MTKREAAIVSAYTGILLGEFHEMHKYIEEILNKPVLTHQLADKNMWELIKDKSRIDFITIKIND